MFFNLYGDNGPYDDILSNVWWNAGGPGYVLAGSSEGHCILTHLDLAGNVQSSTGLGSTSNSEDCVWAQDPAGGYFVNLQIVAPTPDGSMVLARLDPSESILWQKHFVGRDLYASIVPMPDGGLATATSIGSCVPAPACDGWAVRVDAAGATVWERAYGESAVTDYFTSSVLHDDGDLVLVGTRHRQPWVLKVDPNGEIAPGCPFGSATTTAVEDYTATTWSQPIAMRPAAVSSVASSVVVLPLSETGFIECSSAGCASVSAVRNLRAVKLGGGRARLLWDGSSDPCHLRYAVYRSTVPGMRPLVPPGTWPSDPLFEDVSSTDLDGSRVNTAFEWIWRGAADEYFLVVDVGSDGQPGPVGSFGR